MPNEWRKTSDDLPELTQYVWSCDCHDRREVVTGLTLLNYPKMYPHWMPIDTPEPPEKGDHNV